MTRVRLPGKQPNKYGAKGEHLDGFYFDSRAELHRYEELKLLERGGAISGLVVHPRFVLQYPGTDGEIHDIATYEGDFYYVDHELGVGVLEDVKTDATRTQLYRIKKRLVEAQFGIKIVEVTM